jgi:hypothetical protein
MVDKPYFKEIYETRGVKYLQLNLFVLKADDFISYQRDIHLLTEYSSKCLPERLLEAVQLQRLCSVDIRCIKAMQAFNNSLQSKLKLERRKERCFVPSRNDQTLTTKAPVKSIKQNWRMTCLWISSLMQLLMRLLLSPQRPSHEA